MKANNFRYQWTSYILRNIYPISFAVYKSSNALQVM